VCNNNSLLQDQLGFTILRDVKKKY